MAGQRESVRVWDGREVQYKTEAWLSPPTAPAESPPDLIMSRFDDTCLTGEVHGHSHTLGAALPFLAQILRNSQAGRSLITPIQYTYSVKDPHFQGVNEPKHQ